MASFLRLHPTDNIVVAVAALSQPRYLGGRSWSLLIAA